jgi:hypothetical protein
VQGIATTDPSVSSTWAGRVVVLLCVSVFLGYFLHKYIYMILKSHHKSLSYYHCLRAYDNSIHYGIVRTLHIPPIRVN